MSAGTRETTTAWVCVDCYETHHGVREDDTAPDREPLGLIGEDVEVTAGLMAAEHADDCPNVDVAGNWTGEAECECEHVTFSWHACHGCGSTLGGAREALTVWS